MKGMEEKFEEKVFEYKVKNLIALRTTLCNMIAVLAGGVMWLTFLDAPKYRLLFVVIGVYFVCLFAISLIKTITELNTIIYKKKGIK